MLSILLRFRFENRSFAPVLGGGPLGTNLSCKSDAASAFCVGGNSETRYVW